MYSLFILVLFINLLKFFNELKNNDCTIKYFVFLSFLVYLALFYFTFISALI